MKRFVSYLYSIYNSQKIHNAGFARMELRTGRNRVEIHLKENGYAGKTGTVYLFIRKQENIQGISIGNITFRNNQAEFRYEQAEENIGQTPWKILQMNGIIIMIEGRAAFLSQWDELPVDTARFEVWDLEKKKEESTGLQTEDSENKQENKQSTQNGAFDHNAQTNQTETMKNRAGTIQQMDAENNACTERQEAASQSKMQDAQQEKTMQTEKRMQQEATVQTEKRMQQETTVQTEKRMQQETEAIHAGELIQQETVQMGKTVSYHTKKPGSTLSAEFEADGLATNQSVSGAGQRSDAGQETGAGQRSDAGQETGAGQRSDAGQEAGAGQGADAGQETGAGQGSDTGREADVHTAELQPQVQDSWSQNWRYMLRTFPVLNQFKDEDHVLCVRIEIKDVRLLPEKYWSIINNSFLLHGFFNYRYLAFGKIEQSWFVGVPGIYQNQEHVMASIFGFPDFLAQKQKNEQGEQPGYWYRILM